MGKMILASVIGGALFGAGLIISGMTLPARVIGFLDVQNWDPTLMFVMVGAILVHVVAYRIVNKRSSPFLAPQFDLPTKTNIDRRLIIGSALFGAGWGLGGYCPGPSLASLPVLTSQVLVFVLMMLCGMFVENVTNKVK
jgi:hypothetical protein